jgi:hypothetical protein
MTLAAWLLVSPLVFGGPPGDCPDLVPTWVAASLVALFALLSFRPKLSRMHVTNLAVGAWLIGRGIVVAGERILPAQENDVIVGLLLLMFAVVPTHASVPPRAWREFHA